MIHRAIFAFITLLVWQPAVAQHLYPFTDYRNRMTETWRKSYCIDLDKLKIVQQKDAGNEDFKANSKYNHRFGKRPYISDGKFAFLDPDEHTVAGHIIVDEKGGAETINTRYNKWTVKLDNAFAHVCEALVADGVLVVSDYCRLTETAGLCAYDLYTGKLLWRGDVISKPVGNDKYYNQVILSLYEGKVIMEGNETNVSYVQIFGLRTGKRLLSTL